MSFLGKTWISSLRITWISLTLTPLLKSFFKLGQSSVSKVLLAPYCQSGQSPCVSKKFPKFFPVKSLSIIYTFPAYLYNSIMAFTTVSLMEIRKETPGLSHSQSPKRSLEIRKMPEIRNKCMLGTELSWPFALILLIQFECKLQVWKRKTFQSSEVIKRHEGILKSYY